MRLFETFWIAPKGHPFICFVRYFATQWMSKNRKGPPFYIFRHCDTVQKSHFQKFLGNFFMSPKVPPSFKKNFLQPAGVSQSPKGPPFPILSLRYGADFGRSRLVPSFFWSFLFQNNKFIFCNCGVQNRIHSEVDED